MKQNLGNGLTINCLAGKSPQQSETTDSETINKQKALNELIPPNLIQEVLTQNDLIRRHPNPNRGDDCLEETKQRLHQNGGSSNVDSTSCSNMRQGFGSVSKHPQSPETVLERRTLESSDTAITQEHPSKGAYFYHNAPKF